MAFTKLPFAGLILRWQKKLESATSQSYVDLIQMLEERESKLSDSFNQLSGGVDGTFTTADAKTVTVKNGIITSIV